MLLRDLLEAPLPDDWDHEIYNERVPMSTRIEYARQRAQQIGSGSSRVAFVIPYKGRDTVLKIAKNRKGMLQNKEETAILSDHVAQRTGILIPMIDYDMKNSTPTWVHTEFAQKMPHGLFVRLFKGQIHNILNSIEARMNGRPIRGEEPHPEVWEIPEVTALEQLLSNFPWIHPADFGSPRNWGIYKGRPVIIDVGFTYEVSKRY